MFGCMKCLTLLQCIPAGLLFFILLQTASLLLQTEPKELYENTWCVTSYVGGRVWNFDIDPEMFDRSHLDQKCAAPYVSFVILPMLLASIPIQTWNMLCLIWELLFLMGK